MIKRSFQQLISYLFLLVFSLAMTPTAFAADKNFSDVKTTDWFYDAVQYSVAHGMVSGTSDTTFSPNNTMTRGQFVTVLGRMDGVDVSNTAKTGKFTDVKADDYFAAFVYWAADVGITSGTTATTFSPNANVTREQMAAFVARYLAHKGVTLPADKNAVQSFKDAGSISSWALESVDMLRSCGLLAGDNLGNVNPQNTLTRAEGVTVLMRLREALVAEGVALGDGSIDPTPSTNEWGLTENTISLSTNTIISYKDLLNEWSRGKLDEYGISALIVSSDNRDIITVNKKSGTLVPQAVGTTTVTWDLIVSSNEVWTTTATVNVTQGTTGIPTTGIDATITSTSFHVGSTAQITYNINPGNATDKTVTFSVADPSIASVSSSGLVTGLKIGQTTVSVTTSGGQSASMTITITDPEDVFPHIPVDSQFIADFNAELLRLINEMRAENGLPAYVYDSRMQDGANIRAYEMSELWSHIRPNGKYAHDVFGDTFGPLSFANFGENGHMCYGKNIHDAETLAYQSFDGWMNSPGHKRQLVLEGVWSIAAGVCEANDNVYVAFLNIKM